MALNSDRDGFLLPDRNLRADDLAQGIGGIKRNTDAILTLLRGRTRTLDRSRVANPNSPQRGPGSPPGPTPAPAARQSRDRASVPVPVGGGSAGGARPRDGRGRFTRDPGAEVAGEVRQLTRQQAQQNAERERAEESRRTRDGVDQTRDSRGRFGSGGESGGGAGGADGDKGLLGRMRDFFKDHSGGPALDGADKLDPAVESAKEVAGLMSGAVGAVKATGELGRAVVGRGFGGPSGERETPWFKRLLQQLKLMRRDDAQFHRAELRALNEPRSGGGGGSIVSDLLKLIFSPLGVAIVAALAGVWVGFGDKITGAWSGFIGSMKAKWDTAVEKFLGIWEPIAKFFADKFGIVASTAAAVGNRVNEAVKQATGVDVKNAASRAADVAASKAGSLAERFNKGYRHKAMFDGIKGGGDLTKYGRYTDAEAEKIRQLKSSGANTSASLPGGMSKQTRDKIIAQSKAAGVDPETMLKFAAMESGGNPNAVSPTGAIGTFQIVGGTASGLGVADRFNEDQNIAGGVKLAKANAKYLTNNKLPVTPENLYMMHMLGPQAAREVIAGARQGKQVSELSQGTRDAIAKNHGKGAKTAAEFIGINKGAMDQRYGAVVPSGAETQIAAGRPGGNQAGAMRATSAPGIGSPTAAPAMVGAVPTVGVLSGPPRIATVAIPAQSPPAPSPRADTQIPLGSKAPLEVTVRNSSKLAGQDVKDRRLAHIATGGMSG